MDVPQILQTPSGFGGVVAPGIRAPPCASRTIRSWSQNARRLHKPITVESRGEEPSAVGRALRRSQGLLRRTPVFAACFHYIGKETDRRWEQGEDISIAESEVTQYTPNETARLVADPELQLEARRFSIRALAKVASLPENTIKAVRRGDRGRSTIEKTKRALRELRC